MRPRLPSFIAAGRPRIRRNESRDALQNVMDISGCSIDTEETLEEMPWLVTIAASAGGIEALRQLLARLPRDLSAAVIVLQHRPAQSESILPWLLSRSAQLPVLNADENAEVVPGNVYVARPHRHLTISAANRFSYIDGTRIRSLRSSANPLFASAAEVYGPRLIAVVLTGSGYDATDGVQAVKAHGGRVIAQDPSTARYTSMPLSAVETGAVDYVLPLDGIAAAIAAITRGEPVAPASTA